MTSDTAETFYQKGIQHDEKGKPQAAIASYSQAIALKPGYTEAWMRRGLTWMLLNQFEPAIGNFNQAVALRPEFDLAWYLKAYCHAQIGADDIALLSLGKAITLNPEQWNTRASQEPGFDNLRPDPRFQELVAQS
ncbi:MAG: tetratricopeptide repeat protein [Cyanobacteria bacterium P01_D01_bin.44]